MLLGQSHTELSSQPALCTAIHSWQIPMSSPSTAPGQSSPCAPAKQLLCVESYSTSDPLCIYQTRSKDGCDGFVSSLSFNLSRAPAFTLLVQLACTIIKPMPLQ